jgi:hypothetical protein
MKIQEMRSGIAHLNKKTEREPQGLSEYYWPDSAGAARGLAENEPEQRTETPSDLDQAVWSVVSFDRREAGGLTYRQAAELIAFMNGRGAAAGLCIITDEAAARYDG